MSSTPLVIIGRREWGARYDNGFGDAPTPASELWLHHTVTLAPDLVAPWDDDDEAVRALERIGEQRFGGGISYTFPITPSGRIYEGHSVDRRGAHTKNHNTAGRAIALIGDYSSNPPTRMQVVAAGLLVRHGREQGWWKVDRLSGGHRDSQRPGYTSCPGDAGHAAIAEVNAVALGGAVPPPYQPPVVLTPTDLLPLWPFPRDHWLGTPHRDPRNHSGYFSAADNRVVKLWQVAMRRRGWSLSADGKYGPATAKVCASFQREKGLAVDGKVGPVTWATTDTAAVT